MTAATDLADRVAAGFDPGRVRLISMFGGRAVMLDDRMLVCAGRDGRLLVRIDPSRNFELLALPGAEPAVMGEKSMGPGWLFVTADRVATAEGLGFWVDEALRFHESR